MPIQRIEVDEMRKRFNTGGFQENVASGEWTTTVMESRISKNLPEETVEITSVMLSYQDKDGNEMARVHQYQRPDGSLAASGKPDPKRLVQNGVLYRLKKGQ
jgi:hypothetical protein